MTPQFPGISLYILEQGFPDMLSPGLFIDAEVVDVEGGDFLEASAALVLNGAEDVAEDTPFTFADEDRGLRIVKDGKELGIRVLLAGFLEEVRTAFVVDREHLLKEAIHSLQVARLGFPYGMGNLFHCYMIVISPATLTDNILDMNEIAILAQCVWILNRFAIKSFCQFLVHLEEAGNDVGFRGVFGEAVCLQDGGIVGAVGLAEFGRHRHLIIEVCETAVRIEGTGIKNSLGGLLNFALLGI